MTAVEELTLGQEGCPKPTIQHVRYQDRRLSQSSVVHSYSTDRHLLLKCLKRRHAQELSVAARPAFIAPDLWPPNSHDLSPADYKIWSIIQQRICQKKVQDLKNLKQCLIDVCASVQQSFIDDVTDQWRRRLHACI